MPTLQFAVQTDVDKVIKLREEINRLENELQNLGDDESADRINELEHNLADCKDEMVRLIDKAAKAGSVFDEQSATMANSMKKVGTMMASAFAFDKLAGFVEKMVDVRSEFQAADTAIETMLGSKEKADALMSRVREYAKISPLEFSQVTEATKQMIGFNIEADKIPRFLQAIGDVSMGDGNKFSSLALAFSQISASGKLMGQDLMQLVNAGFNPLQVISEKTGKSIGALKDEMSKGAISAEMVQQAFVDATSAGGMFYQMSEKGAQTIGGQISMLQDAVDAMYNELGTKSEGFIVKAISGATDMVQHYETIGKVLLTVATSYGIYKAAVLAVLATEKAAVISRAAHIKGLTTLGFVTDVLKTKTAALNATMLANPYVAVGAAVVALATAFAIWHKELDATQKAEKTLNGVQEDATRKMGEEKAKLETLIATAKNEEASLDRRRKATEELNRIIPNYNAQIDASTGKYKASEEALSKYCDQLVRQYELEGAKSKLQELGAQKAENAMRRAEAERAKGDALQKAADENKRKQQQQKGAITPAGYAAPSEALADLSIANKKLADAAKLDAEIAEKERVLNKMIQDGVKQLSGTEEKKTPATEPAPTTPTGKGKDIAGETADRLQRIEDYKRKVGVAVTAAELDIRQKQLDVRADSYEKQKAQIALNYDKLLYENQQREKQMSDALKDKMTLEWQNANPKADKQAVKDYRDGLRVGRGDLAAEQREVLDAYDVMADAIKEKELNTLQQAQDAAMREYLKAYGSYQEQRLAITQEYAEKISEASTEGDKRRLEKDRDKEIKQLDMRQFTESGAYQMAFGNLDSVSTDMLKDIMQNLEAYKAQIAASLTPTELKEYQTAIQNVLDELAERDPFTAWKESLEELKASEEELNAANDEVARARKELDSATMAVGVSKATGDAAALAKALERQQNAYAKLHTATQKQATAQENHTRAEQKNKTATDQVIKSWSKCTSELKNIGDQLGGVGGAALSVIGTIGGTVLSTIDAVKAASAAGATAISTIEKASVILAIISAALQVATALFSMFGADYSGYNKMKESYDALNDVWDKLIAKKEKYISIDYGDEARKAGAEVARLYKKEIESAVTLGLERLNAGASAGSHSIGVRQRKRMTNADWAELRKASNEIGFNYNSVADGRMEGLFDLSSEQLSRLQEEAPTFWAKLDEDVKEYLQKIIDCGDAIEENKKKMQEALTGVNFDGFYDGFVSLLTDMDKGSADFADNFGEYIRKSVLQNLMANKYRSRLESLYNQFASMADSDGNGSFDLTGDEAKLLKEAQKNLTNEMMAEREQLSKVFDFTSSTAEQTATARGYTQMSEETGGEISGRMTAINESQLRAEAMQHERNNVLAVLDTRVSDLQGISTGIRDIASDTRDIIASSYLELQGIRENTDTMVVLARKTNDAINDMRLNGVKMK